MAVNGFLEIQFKAGWLWGGHYTLINKGSTYRNRIDQIFGQYSPKIIINKHKAEHFKKVAKKLKREFDIKLKSYFISLGNFIGSSFIGIAVLYGIFVIVGLVQGSFNEAGLLLMGVPFLLYTISCFFFK
jgi:hypothetical protein